MDYLFKFFDDLLGGEKKDFSFGNFLMEELYEFFVEIEPLFHYFQRKRTKSIKRIDSFLYK